MICSLLTLQKKYIYMLIWKKTHEYSIIKIHLWGKIEMHNLYEQKQLRFSKHLLTVQSASSVILNRLTTYRPPTDHLHVPTTYRPPTAHLLTTYRPPIEHLRTTYQPPTNHLPTTYWALIDHLPTTYRPPIEHLRTTYQPPTDHQPTAFLQCSFVQYYRLHQWCLLRSHTLCMLCTISTPESLGQLREVAHASSVSDLCNKHHVTR